MKKFLVCAKQLVTYEFYIERETKAEVDDFLRHITIDCDSMENYPDITRFEQPEYLEVTEVIK